LDNDASKKQRRASLFPGLSRCSMLFLMAIDFNRYSFELRAIGEYGRSVGGLFLQGIYRR